MPKDDSGPAPSAPLPESDPSYKTPLKRGDACLYCRKRRIRCSATKPSCHHCTKLKRECVYDTGKPVSRVKQLEDKVAELEDMLRSSAGSGSGSGLGSGIAAAVSMSTSEISPTTTGGIPRSAARDQARPSVDGNGGNGWGGGNGITPQPTLPQHGSSGSGSTGYTISVNGESLTQPGPGSSSGAGAPAPQTYNMSLPMGDFSMVESIDTNMLNRVSTPPNLNTNAYFGMSPGFWGFMGSMFGGTGPGEGSGAGMTQGINNFHPSGQTQAVEETFDFSTLDPGLMDLVNSFQETTTAPAQTSQAQQQVQQTQPQQQQQQQQQQQPASMDTPAALAYLSQTASTLPSQPDFDTTFGLPQNTSQSLPSSISSLSQQPPPALWPQANDFSGVTAQVPSSVPRHSSTTSTATDTFSFGSTPSSNSVPYQAYVIDVPDSGGSTSASNISPQHGPLEAQAIGLKDEDTSGRNTLPADGKMGEGYWRTEGEMKVDDDGTLVGGWFDAADVPKAARDHLLDLFFSGMRMFGQEFHVPRFFASLTLPPAKRPHPCLLYSMYLMASRISTSQPIRALEGHFYSIASRQLDESIARADRLLDATRAAAILAVYKYSLARYHEGMMMGGMAARLAISCGLHQIASSVWKPSPVPQDQRADLVGIMRTRTFVIPPPKDPIELGERISAFWSIYITDRCGSISAQWPPAIADSDITTPFPKPLYEYEVGLVSTADDYTISTLWGPEHRPLKHYAESTMLILRIRALGILERASKLMYLKPEPGWEAKLNQSSRHSSLSGSFSGASASGSNSASPMSHSHISPSGPIDEYLRAQNYAAASGQDPLGVGKADEKKGWMRTARIRNPTAFDEVRLALMRVEEDLPPERRTNWEAWDGIVQPWHYGGYKRDVVTLHFVLGCAWMFLFDVYSFMAENTLAVNVARRLAFTIRMVVQEQSFSEMDVFIAMTWSFIVKILIRETKRLQSIGDTSSAALVEADVETVVQALRLFGRRYNIAWMQAMRAERYRRSTLDDMSFMEGDKLDDEHVQVERLKGALGAR